MKPEPIEVQLIAEGLAVAAGYTRDEWREGNHFKWASAYWQAAHRAIDDLYASGLSRAFVSL